MSILGDPYDPNWDAFQWEMPEWIHVWDARKSWYPFSRIARWLRIVGKLGEYDLVVGHVPFAKVATLYKCLYRKPYIVFDAGWIRYLTQNMSGYSQARKGYREAAMILFTCADTEHLFEEQGYGKLIYTPFAIDTEKYSPVQSHGSGQEEFPKFFHPSRQDWAEKGNDLLIEAFARYLKRSPKAKLTMVEWYQSPEDLARSKRLVLELGIESNVNWVPVMPKNKLVECYRDSTAVFDQFLFGAFGTTAPEAMSCGKPVVGYVEPKFWTRYHDQIPPAVNARTIDAIYDVMVKLEDEEFRDQCGKLGRKWVLENCDSVLVASKQLELYKQVMDRS